MTRAPHRSFLAAAAVAAALALAACGGNDDEPADESAATPEATPAATETPAPEAGGAAEISKDTSAKPEIPKPEGEPPAKLTKRDIVKGKGKAAKNGDQVTVHYVGVSYSTGQQFDASWDAGQPFPFTLGEGAVIPGWEQGVKGMKAGGRRELIIPPDMAYGEAGAPPDIGPNETLVFVIDALNVQ